MGKTSVPVDGEPFGFVMQKSKKRGGMTISPVKFDIRDSHEKKLLKTLAYTMTAYDPRDRPSVDEVLKELQSISGIYILWIFGRMFQNV